MPHAPELAPFLARHHNDNYAIGKRSLPEPLFATYAPPASTARRVRVVAGTKHGRIGITENLAEETSPEIYVPQSHLSQFMSTPYPMRILPSDPQPPGKERQRREAKLIAAARVARLRRTLSVDGAGLVERACSILGISAADITGESKSHLSISVRRALLGILAAKHIDYSLPALASFVNVHHTSVHHALVAVGLRGDGVTDFDVPYLRASWRGLGLPIGYAAGHMPAEVAARLGAFVTQHNGWVEPSTWGQVRKWLAPRIVDERRGDLQCAA